ncbi:MAG: hypothetical protein U9R49_00620 [Bacteroidota bacterium]|nr:hypothetical protein [Bacteroidota bacterium]
MGGSRVCVAGYWCSSQNQAGLGFIDRSSISLQHSMPYLLKELGISSLSGQFATQRGGLGMALSTWGLRGLRQNSLWLSYGLKLHTNISAGLGIHLWNASCAEQLAFAPGVSFALGLQIRINEQWMLGARLIHPAGWSAQTDLTGQELMSIEAGFSYSFFRTSQIYAELHIKPGYGIILCTGMEWTMNRQISLRTGICNSPFTYSWGIALKFKKWIAEFSFLYRVDTGLSPLSSLTHAW